MLENNYQLIFDKHYTINQTPNFLYCVFDSENTIISGSSKLAEFETLGLSTQFRIASMSKSFTSLAVLCARDEGYLKLSDKISKYLKIHTVLEAVTIKDLLSMSSGLITDDPWADRLLDISDANFEDILKQKPQLINYPRCNYSNYGYMILGRIVSNATGIHALEYISKNILQKLGLTRTSWNPIDANFSEGFTKHSQIWEKEKRYTVISDSAVFGGLWSTISDLVSWVRFLKSESEEYPLDELKSARFPNISNKLKFGPIENRSYAYGLSVSEIDRYKYLAHSGGLPGYSSHMRWCEDTGISVVAVTNGTYAPVWEACTEALYQKPILKKNNQELIKIGNLLVKYLNNSLISEEAIKSTSTNIFSHNFFLDLPKLDFDKKIKCFIGLKIIEILHIPTLETSGLSGRIIFENSSSLRFDLSPFMQIQKLVF